MERLISVSAFEFLIERSSLSIIQNYREFNLECKRISEYRGYFKDKYILKLNGEEKNIQMYIDYLKLEGFKVKLR